MKHRMQLALYWVDKADESVNSATSELDAGSWLRTLLTLMKNQAVYDVCLRQSTFYETALSHVAAGFIEARRGLRHLHLCQRCLL